MKLTFDEVKSEIKRVLIKYGISEEKAETCARIRMETTYGGVYSHGTNRVARFVNYIQKGWVDVNTESFLGQELNALRVYSENMGPGVLNALYRANRAMELADQYDIGMVGIRNTTHWMWSGTYGLCAARKRYVATMWTNTESCMPPWGDKEYRLGSNPFVMATPSTNGGEPFQLNMAVSQYSCGKLQVTRLAGEKLPYPGGFDNEDNLTDNPGAIEQSRRVLLIGYWEGSTSLFMLDILESMSTDSIGAAGVDQKEYGSCGGCSRVVIVMDPGRTTADTHMKEVVDTAVLYVKNSASSEGGGSIKAPGQGSTRFYREHGGLEIYVNDDVWKEVQSL